MEDYLCQVRGDDGGGGGDEVSSILLLDFHSCFFALHTFWERADWDEVNRPTTTTIYAPG